MKVECQFCGDMKQVTSAKLDDMGHPIRTPIPCPHCTSVGRPKIVCLCGSTKFKDTFLAVQKRFTLEGKIVLSVGFFGHAEGWGDLEQFKNMLDALHFAKINMADEVHVINVDQYIGDSTRREIEFALLIDKPVTYEWPATVS